MVPMVESLGEGGFFYIGFFVMYTERPPLKSHWSPYWEQPRIKPLA